MLLLPSVKEFKLPKPKAELDNPDVTFDKTLDPTPVLSIPEIVKFPSPFPIRVLSFASVTLNSIDVPDPLKETVDPAVVNPVKETVAPLVKGVPGLPGGPGEPGFPGFPGGPGLPALTRASRASRRTW